MVAVLAVATALILISTTTQAQASNGAVPNLQLSSASPGELTIAWDAPDPTPSDYRLIWAEQSLDFLSYKNSNEANRGNEYPSGSERSITLTGLTKGFTFKVKSRARYTSGGDNDGAWSGPWTDTVTARVKDDLPTAPTGLTASQVAHDSVTINWAAPSQGTVTSYRVMRGTETGSLSTIEEDTGNIDVEYTDSTVAAETTYYYAVLALSQDGDGVQSTTVSTTTPAEAQPVPSAPTGLTTSGVAHDSVTISWTSPSQGSVTGYRILRGTDSNSLSAIVQNTDSTATEYTDSTVTAATTYYYAVLALSAEGDGNQSADVSATTPAAPQQTAAPIRLSSTTAGQLTISWDAPDPSPSDYRIVWAKQDLGFPSYTAANEANRGNEYPSGDDTSITLTGLSGGSTFKVKARTRYTSGGDNNGAWSGPWSDTVTARVKDDLPTAPTGLTVSQVAHGSVTLTWTAPSSGSTVSGYRVLRGTDANSLSTIAQDTGNTSTEYTDTAVAAETTYHYAVLALSQDGDGAQSATVSTTTTAAPQQRESKDPPKGPPVPNRVTRGVPTVTSIVRQSPTSSPTNADTLTWRVTFSEAVQRVDATDFSVSGTTATLAVSEVTGVTGAYDVTATGGTLASLDATVTLSIVTGHNIQSTTSDALTNTTPTGTNDATYAVDNTAPTLTSARVNDGGTFVQLLFSENLDRSNLPPTSAFTVTADGIGGTVTSVAVPSSLGVDEIWILVSPVIRRGQAVVVSYTDPTTGNDGVAIQDAAGNDASSFTTGSNSVPAVTNTSIIVPTVTSIVRQTPTSSPTNANSLTWRVTFSTTVQNVDAADFSVAGTTATVTAVSAVSGVTGTYDVTASGGDLADLNGTVTLSFAATQNIQDTSSNALTNTTPTGTNRATYVLDNTPPTLARARIGGIREQVVLVFSEDIALPLTAVESATFLTTLKSAFSVTGAGNTVHQVTGIITSSAKREELTLTVSPATTRGQVVVVSYTDPTAGDDAIAVQDALGNDAASFTTGTNNVPAVTTLTPPNATGAPAITASNAFQFESVLTANKGSIADADGLPLESTFTWQWLRQTSSYSYVDIPGATGQTYTLTATDAGKTIKVQARFTDNSGTREGPLTSAATPAIYIHPDSIPPTVASVEITQVSGVSLLTITFTEELNLRFPPRIGIGTFTAKKTPAGGSEQTATFTGNSYNNKYTWGRVLTEVVLPTDRVTVSYAKPTGLFKLKDLFGNDVENFTDVLARKRHEPSGQDFSHYHDTLGFVSVGQDSSGRLTYPADGDPWADYGDSGWGDMFNLVGLEASKTYRVEVDFIRVANTVGGSIQLYNCCNHGPDPYAVSEWDSNYDGRAIFDFKTGRTESGNTRFVSIIPSNSMNPDVWEFGDYTVTLTDVTGLTRLVSNTSQRPRTVTYAKVGKNTDLHATDKTQLATSFETGSNADGYTLDRITAYIERTITGSTVTGVPKAAIHNNATGNLPGAKLCDLQSLADYETGLNLSNGDWPDRLYAPDCANNTLSASTTYWVVFSEDSSPAQTYFVGEADSNAQDPHGASGWHISDTYYRKTGGNAWVSAGLFPLAIGVYGTPK